MEVKRGNGDSKTEEDDKVTNISKDYGDSDTSYEAEDDKDEDTAEEGDADEEEKVEQGHIPLESSLINKMIEDFNAEATEDNNILPLPPLQDKPPQNETEAITNKPTESTAPTTATPSQTQAVLPNNSTQQLSLITVDSTPRATVGQRRSLASSM